MKFRASMLVAVGLALATTVAALAAGFVTNGMPPAGGTQYPTTVPLTGNETLPADTNLLAGQNPASEAVTTNQLAGFVNAFGPSRNALIGGDFGLNLFQRGTTSASITTALLYGPDRWWGLSGTGTAFTVIKQTGATDITAGFAASARVQRTAAQTGVVATCVGQVLTSANSTQFQGQKAEFSFYAQAGANFSAANSQVTATIGTGTGADDTAANFSTGAWAGFAKTDQVITLTSAFGRYSVVANIPAAATQVGVKICFTPVGTAGTNDWFEFTGAQLDVNAAAVASTGAALTASSIAAFERRLAPVETALQQAYFWQVAEGATTVRYGLGQDTTTTNANIVLALPTTMRAAPTVTATVGTFTVTIPAGTAQVCTALAAVASASTNQSITMACTVAANLVAGSATQFTGGGGSGLFTASAEF